jgi:hypothetical protein
MVNTGFYVSSGSQLEMNYYITRRAFGYWWDGIYPTVASLDAELEEYRIS